MYKLLNIAAALALGAAFTGQASAKAQFDLLHSFCAKANCTDGATPQGALLADGMGNYYGTTAGGGDQDQGTVFKASFDGSQWRFTRIYSFCVAGSCPSGGAPRGGLIMDTAGNLYGTASGGGANGGGTIFKLTPQGGKWRYSVIYSFCGEANCTDGSQPQYVTLAYRGQASGVPYDGMSPLYGTASAGGMGAVTQDGAVFALTPNGKHWKESLVYSFCSQTNCNDGGVPFTGVAIDGSGNLFGTAAGGGQFQQGDDGGVLYELKPNGAHWKYSVLHAFCADREHDRCQDGSEPLAMPMLDASGDVFGTAIDGGANSHGVVWELPATGKFSVLHTFCSKTNCPDGAAPGASGLVMDSKGDLFGATLSGGDAAANDGVVFELTGAKHTTFTGLVLFKGPNGENPYAPLSLDASGDLFGLASGGGKTGLGTFFRITP
jgi:uncharacterized repeat protein (TIGR03803 family)